MDFKKNNNGRYWAKALIGSVGCIAVATTAYLLQTAHALWALALVGWIVEKID